MKRIALINDLSGFGKCSLTAAIPVVSVMGIQACPLPTAVLSAQTGFENYYCDDFTDRMDEFTAHWKQMGVTFDGIYSGYLANPLQMDKVTHFLEQFQGEHTLYLADPVMGDGGKKFGMCSEAFLQGMKKLTELADVITPNLTELCLLAGEDCAELMAHSQDEDYIERIQHICEKLQKQAKKPQTIIVTGILREKIEEKANTKGTDEKGLAKDKKSPQDNSAEEIKRESIGNLAVTPEEHFYLESPYTGRSFSGTGDLFASVICASLVKGLSVEEAVRKASNFLQEAIEGATAENIPRDHGVSFEKYLGKLL